MLWATQAFAGAENPLSQDAATLDPANPNGFSMGIASGPMQYRSTERTAAGSVTNEESGRLRQLSWTGQWTDSTWSVQGRLSVARNDIGYDGYTQFGIPLHTTTQLALHQGGLFGGYRWRAADHTHWVASAGLERLQINRNILPGLGSLPLREVLTSDRFVAGMTLQQDWPNFAVLSAKSPLRLSVDVSLIQALRNSLYVDSYGLYDPITLQTGNRIDWRVGLHSALQLTPQLTVSMGLVREQFTPGSSGVEIWSRAGVAVAGVRYPGSQQQMQSLTAGLTWRF